ncbi:arginase [uncultured Cohaesibacter sp.]|uniref:arginase n=1 Tax=uncultured Cohaesibacter sp. TaxID=1002546 RepID=UPI00292E8BF6|nr:arginase [uncultured Cohaesibacter sp.]
MKPTTQSDEKSVSTIALLGVPVQDGTHEKGCLMGPAALRTAGIVETLERLGFACVDHGDLHPPSVVPDIAIDGKANNAGRIASWTRALADKAYDLAKTGFPLFMGGDHSLSMGSVSGIAQYAFEQQRPLYVLWLDAHTDFNTPLSSETGNMHGMPVAAFCGLEELAPLYTAPLANPVKTSQVHMMGIRSVDSKERELLKQNNVRVSDMRILDEVGIVRPLMELIDEVLARNAMLHVSLDVDFLDPEIAPAVGTTVPGGATFREAHLIMELLHESACVTSLDLVELNPFLDHRGKTAELLTDLTASLFGRKIFDRPTRRPRPQT